jgi:type I restriction enzyme S subunit
MGRYQAYPEYKNSGVEWLEDLPAHWEIKRTKAMFSLARQLVGKKSKDYQLLSLTLKGVIPRDISDGGGKIPAEFDTYQVVRPRNLIFCLFDIDETPRTIGISSYDGMITGAYNVYSALEPCIPEYSYYYFMHIDSFKGLKPFYTGLRKVVRAETFSNIKMPVPSKDEQEKIANFLDHETAKIDTLIDKQQQLIKLLKEKRQAVISHAVTKGLNPNAPMRDSGVEWLGEVPEHWEMVPVKHISKIRYGIGEPPKYQDEGIPLIRATNIRSGKISEIGLVLVNPDDIPGNRIVWLDKGDIIVVRSGAGTGDSSIIPNEYQGSIAGFDMVVRPTKCLPEFLGHVLLSNYVRNNQIDLEKTRAAQPHLNAEELGECFVLLPTDEEQQLIVSYIDREILKFDDLVVKAEKAIMLMQERRTALISAAVTGKIDVRHFNPEDGQSPEPSNTNNKEVAA